MRTSYQNRFVMNFDQNKLIVVFGRLLTEIDFYAFHLKKNSFSRFSSLKMKPSNWNFRIFKKFYNMDSTNGKFYFANIDHA